MFDGVPAEQFHQFIDSSRTSSLPISLSFPLHGSFDPYPSRQTLESHLLHQLHHQSTLSQDGEENSRILSTNSAVSDRIDPWSNDEVLSLLKIRSSMENWFPDLTWQHVSRKLTEYGFKRSAEKCKEKFEEETRDFNSISFNKNRFFSELEELYNGENPPVQSTEKTQSTGKPNEEEEDPRNVVVAESEEVVNKSTKSKKRKRGKKFKMFKGFCIDIVNKMMAQQEEMHNKLLEDMVNRDEEKIAREEAWKKQEMERINKEIEIKAHEQAIAGDRQATVIEFFKKLTSNCSENKSFEISLRYEDLLKVSNTLSSLTSSTESLPPSNPSSTLATNIHKQANTSTLELASQNHNSSNVKNNPAPFTLSPAQKAQKDSNSGTNEREDIGKRWPKDEVLALINMRCSLDSNNNDQDKEGGGAKSSLWERISQGMLELGYKRSAKRCKEKWENINKYFKKTKDVNKKRSVDSRTCPYFPQLSTLYNQRTLVAPVDGPENHSALPKTDTALPKTSPGPTSVTC